MLLTLKLLLLGTLIFISPNISPAWCWETKEAVFKVLGLVFIAVSWMSKKESKNVFKNNWLSLIFIYIVLSFGWWTIYPCTIKGYMLNKQEMLLYLPIWNLWPSLNVIIAILMIYILTEYIDLLDFWRGIAKFICCLSFGIACYALLQRFGYEPLPIIKSVDCYGHFRMFAVFGNSSLTAGYLASTLPLFYIFKNRYSIIAGLVIFITICMTTCITAIVSSLIGLLTIYFLLTGLNKRVNKLLLCMIVLAVIAFCFNFWSVVSGQLHGRLEMAGEVIRRMKDNVLFGFGLGSFRRDFTALKTFQAGWNPLMWHSAHNIFIETLYEGGLILVSLLIGYLTNLINNIRQIKMDIICICYISCFISSLVIACGVYSYKVAPLALLIIVYMAVMETYISKTRRV